MEIDPKEIDNIQKSAIKIVPPSLSLFFYQYFIFFPPFHLH
jgi:hypothetical protein